MGFKPSQTAPRRMEPRPVRQKCCPDKRLRQGVQEGAETKALRKRRPSLAMRSKLGVNRIVHRSGSVDLRVGTCMPAPIIGEEEEEVGTRLGCEGWSRPCEEKCERGEEVRNIARLLQEKQNE